MGVKGIMLQIETYKSASTPSGKKQAPSKIQFYQAENDMNGNRFTAERFVLTCFVAVSKNSGKIDVAQIPDLEFYNGFQLMLTAEPKTKC